MIIEALALYTALFFCNPIYCDIQETLVVLQQSKQTSITHQQAMLAQFHSSNASRLRFFRYGQAAIVALSAVAAYGHEEPGTIVAAGTIGLGVAELLKRSSLYKARDVDELEKLTQDNTVMQQRLQQILADNNAHNHSAVNYGMRTLLTENKKSTAHNQAILARYQQNNQRAFYAFLPLHILYGCAGVIGGVVCCAKKVPDWVLLAEASATVALIATVETIKKICFAYSNEDLWNMQQEIAQGLKDEEQLKLALKIIKSH